MARSTRESILTAAAELMRHKGYGAVGMKDIAAGLRRADRLAVSPLPRRQGADRARGADQCRPRLRHCSSPSIVDEYDDLGDAVDAVFTQAAEDMAGTGFANMCPVASVAAEVADTVEELRETSAAVFQGWVDGGSAYFARRGLDASRAREVTLALIGALEGAFVLARTLRSTEPLLAAGRALAPRYRGVAAGTACRGRRRRIRPLSSRTGVHRRG